MSNLWNELGNMINVWYTTRAAGLTAYMLLFVAVSAGMLQGSSFSKGKRKQIISQIHQWCGWFGLLFGMVHGIVLVFDDYIGYSIWQLLIPFAAPHERWLTGLGTVSFYMLLLIMVSSDYMKAFGKKVWRTIHFLALPTYVMALLHGTLLGTDTKSAPIWWMYIITASITGVLLLARIFWFKRKSKSPRPSSSGSAAAI